ncbi:MAG: Flp pilus assembly protein CpaB [Firmicutes bacterium]|nr:Flp pilus assembly protein CpaB [Bacillota bacterium]
MRAQGVYRFMVVVGVGMAAAALVWMRRQEAAAQAGRAAAPATAAVLVPRVDIAAGASLNPGEFVQRRLPVADVPPGSVTSPAAVAGAVARQALWAGEPVVAGMLYASAAQATLAAQLPHGMRAVDLPVSSAAGVGGLLAPGDRVDVVAVVNSVSPARAVVLLTDVPVLAVVGGSAGSAEAGGQVTSGTYTSVVLEVTPRQAAALALAQTSGPLSLALRNPSDSGSPSPTVAPAALVGGVR